MNEEQTISLRELGEVKYVKVYNQAYVDKQQKQIAELEKQNTELKQRNGELAGQKASLERWLGEAKTHIHRLLVLLTKEERSYAVIDEARAFMKED